MPSAASAATTTILGDFSGPPELFYGSAAARASYLRVSLDSGSVVRVTPVRIGDGKLWSFACGGASVTNMTSYDAAGHVIAQTANASSSATAKS
jgi:hypothetical protein